MKKYNIEKFDPNEETPRMCLPYDKGTLALIMTCPYNEKIICKIPTWCFIFLNTEKLYVCPHYKGLLPKSW